MALRHWTGKRAAGALANRSSAVSHSVLDGTAKATYQRSYTLRSCVSAICGASENNINQALQGSHAFSSPLLSLTLFRLRLYS
jgi:hypothetical protein